MAKLSYIFVQAFVASCLLATMFIFTAAEVDTTGGDSEDTDPWQDSVVRNLSLFGTSQIPDEPKPLLDDLAQGQIDVTFNLPDGQQQENQVDDQQSVKKNYVPADERQTTQTTVNDDDDDDDDKDKEQATTLEPTTTTATTTTGRTTTTDDDEDSNEEQTTQTTTDGGDKSDEEEQTTTTVQPTTTTTSTTTERTTTTTEDEDSKEEQTTQTTTVGEDESHEEEQTTTTIQPTTTTTAATEEDDDDDKEEEQDCVGFKPYTDNRYYLQFDGISRWIKQQCPHGLGFDYAACACSITLSSEETHDEPETTTTTTPETTTTTEATIATETTTTTEATVTTQGPRTTVKPSIELCNDCVIIHGVGYAPFPGYCDAFIQCHYFGDAPTSVNIKRCPAGLMWNQDKLTCDSPDSVKCVPENNCPNHKAVDGDQSAYFIFAENRWIRMPCPSGTAYNSITCGCTDRRSGGDDDDDNSSNIQENCLDKKAIPGDKAGFLQLTPTGWTRMPCPATVGYNEQACMCIDRLTSETPSGRCLDKKSIPEDKSAFLQFNGVSWIRMPCPKTLIYHSSKCICDIDVNDDGNDDSKDKDVCKSTLRLTFDNDDATDSSENKFWVNNTGVTFKDGKAYFNGKSRLIIPGLSNKDFGDTVYIFIKYRHTSANSQQTLAANGNCQVRQSVAVCSGKDSVDFYAETKGQLAPAKVNVPRDAGLWQTVVYALDDDNLQGSVGTNKASQSIKGDLDRRHSALVIGGGGNCNNFHGIIDELQVFLCKPDF